MYKFFATNCGDSEKLMQFFLSETLVVGLLLCVLSVTGCIGRGLLTPVFIFVYGTYLCYGALTNNPDDACNPFARQNEQNKASIIIGVVIAVLSITWAAFSAAGNFVKVVTTGGASEHRESADGTVRGRGHSDASDTAEVTNVLAKSPSAGASGPGYQGPADVELGQAKDAHTPLASGSTSAYASHSAHGASQHHDAHFDAKHEQVVDRRIWLFHLIMALGGLYLAMVTTNWGDESKISVVGANPEMSTASMWVRMVTQWLIFLLFAWSLIAPICLKGREFS
jgi:hypothetical protein